MKIQTNQENLLKSISIIIGSIKPNPSIPVIGNIKLETFQGKLHLSATDMNILITSSCIATIESDGSTTIPANLFYDIIKKIPSNTVIDIEKKENFIIIKNGKSRYKLPFIDSSEFPKICEDSFDLDFIKMVD